MSSSIVDNLVQPVPRERTRDTRDRARGRFEPLSAALCVGLATGLAELAIVITRQGLAGGAHPVLGMSRHYLWMVPASSLILFGACGLVLALANRFFARWTTVLAGYLLATLSLLTLLLTIRGLNALSCLLLACGIAAFAVPALGRRDRSQWIGHAVRRTLPWLGGSWAFLFVCCFARDVWAERRALADLPPADRYAPNVLLIVMDTVRADHLSTYAYRRETAPNLTRLAARGVRFERAIATAPWTLPSHSSIFTGRWPHEVGTLRGQPLKDGVPTLAEFLAAKGYATGGFVSNHFNCSYESGLDRGFSRYEDYDVSAAAALRSSGLGWLLVKSAATLREEALRTLGVGGPSSPVLNYQRKDAARVNRDVLRWVDGIHGRPFFAFLNYFDAHDPYLVPQGATRHFGRVPARQEESLLLRDWHVADKRQLQPRDIELSKDAYDDCIAYLDQQLGRLFDELDRRGRLDSTLVIVTSDHGEEFGEHGLFGHGLSLYAPEVHVPLVIAHPRSTPSSAVIADPVSLRDLPATIADLAGLGSASPFPGSSLVRKWSSDRPTSLGGEEPILSEVEDVGQFTGNAGRVPATEGSVAITGPDVMYIKNGSREELYDLDADPSQLHNLTAASDYAPSLTRYRATLRLGFPH